MIIYDIRQYLVNREEFSTNQQHIGFQVLFRGYAVKNWFDMDFSMIKFKECNKVIVRLCVKYYETCWRHRNKAMHNEEIQRSRMKEWYYNEIEYAMHSEYL